MIYILRREACLLIR